MSLTDEVLRAQQLLMSRKNLLRLGRTKTMLQIVEHDVFVSLSHRILGLIRVDNEYRKPCTCNALLNLSRRSPIFIIPKATTYTFCFCFALNKLDTLGQQTERVLSSASSAQISSGIKAVCCISEEPTRGIGPGT